MAEDSETLDQDAPDPATGVAALAAKYGDVQRAAERLFDTNARLLRKVERLEKRPELPDGGKVLTKEEAERFAAFEALKLKPADVQATITERDKLKGDLAKKDRESAREAAAKTLGIEGKDLSPFAGADDLTFEVREQEVERNGKKEKAHVAFVKDADGKESPLADYGKERWGRPFEAILTSTTGAGSGGDRRYVLETGSGSPPAKGSIYDRIREEAKKRQEVESQESVPLEQRLGMRTPASR
jgi:hypothetical protein